MMHKVRLCKVCWELGAPQLMVMLLDCQVTQLETNSFPCVLSLKQKASPCEREQNQRNFGAVNGFFVAYAHAAIHKHTKLKKMG